MLPRTMKLVGSVAAAVAWTSPVLGSRAAHNMQAQLKVFPSWSAQCYAKSYCTPPANQAATDDPEYRRKILALEVDILRHEGRKAPSSDFMRDKDWTYLLTLKTRSARKKYYAFLWENEKKKENQKIKKGKKREENEERKLRVVEEDQQNSHIKYGLMGAAFLLRIYDTTINHWHNNKLVQAMQFGQKIVFDCSYDEHMNKREAINAAKQLMLCFAENRMHDSPFDVHFCNANLSGVTMEYLKSHIPPMHEPSFPLNVHEKSFMELFPKEKLVYLTPHCRNEIETFNPDDIYIVGAMVDKVNTEPLSLAKAKALNIRMATLPLDMYLRWGSGSGKSLTLNQMMSIMLELKQSGDWHKALQVVPRRKIADYQVRQNEQERERAKRFQDRLFPNDFSREKRTIDRQERRPHENTRNAQRETLFYK